MAGRTEAPDAAAMDQRTRTLLADQDGVVARRQLLELGVGVSDVARMRAPT